MMANLSIELRNVNEVAGRVDSAKEIFYARGMSASNGLTLANAAAVAGVNIDELTATLEYRMRRAAGQPQAASTAAVVEEDAELVA